MGFMIALVAGLMGLLLNAAYSLVSTVIFSITGTIMQSLGAIGVLLSLPIIIATSLAGIYLSAAILAIYFIFHTHVYMKAVKK